MVVALDDVQWLDTSSAAVLQIALRRLRDERVGLLATLAEDARIAAPFELERAFPDERLERLWVGPLSLGALHHLLRERLGLGWSSPGAGPRSGDVRRESVLRPRARPRARADGASGRQPAGLRVPASLHELLGGRLGRLPTETSAVVLHAAALARPTVEVVRTRGSARRPGGRSRGARHGRARGRDRARDDSPRSLRAPSAGLDLLRAGPDWNAPQRSPGPRRRGHRPGGAGPSPRAGRRGARRQSPPSWTLPPSGRPAAGPRGRGAPPSFSSSALGLTPADPSRAARRLRSAQFHRLAGNGERGAAMLEELLTEDSPASSGPMFCSRSSSTLRARPGDEKRLFEEALAEAAGDDSRLARILSFRAGVRLFDADLSRHRSPTLRPHSTKPEHAGDPALLAMAIARLGTVETYTTQITPGILERGAEMEERPRARARVLRKPPLHPQPGC